MSRQPMSRLPEHEGNTQVPRAFDVSCPSPLVLLFLTVRNRLFLGSISANVTNQGLGRISVCLVTVISHSILSPCSVPWVLLPNLHRPLDVSPGPMHLSRCLATWHAYDGPGGSDKKKPQSMLQNHFCMKSSECPHRLACTHIQHLHLLSCLHGHYTLFYDSSTHQFCVSFDNSDTTPGSESRPLINICRPAHLGCFPVPLPMHVPLRATAHLDCRRVYPATSTVSVAESN